ncbi:MAG TPA: hypothetical protein VL651_05605 [Bacteroidia bacterium]|jgi:hypothetical protein|nr:hypothetical protein [Bacteroidia bacterium]
MKKLLLLFSFSILHSAFSILHAQKVKWENDTVYKNNAPYCLIKKSGGLEATFSIQTLKGTEVAVSAVDKDLKDENGYPYYRVTFLVSKSIADVPNGFNFGNKLAKACVENDIITGDSLNSGGESRFLVLYPQRKSAVQNMDIVNVANNNNYVMVDRDRKGIVTVMGASIKQSNVEIGSCTEKSGAGGGSTYKTVSFYLPTGTKCAEATFTGAAATSCTIVTFKDNGQHVLTIQNMAMKNEEIARWLVDNYYL